MSWFSDFMTDISGPIGKSAQAGMINQENRKRNLSDQLQSFNQMMGPQLEYAKKQQETLLPGQMELQKQRQDAAFKQALILQQIKNQGKQGGSDMLGFLTSGPKDVPQDTQVMPQTPKTPNYGIGEEAMAGVVPPTQTKYPHQILMDRMGLNQKEYTPRFGFNEKGANVSFAPHTQPATEKASDWVMDRDPISGKVQLINKVTKEVSDVPGATNAQRPPMALTPQAMAAKEHGLDPAQFNEWTPEDAKKVGQTYTGYSGQRAGSVIQAQGENADTIARLAAAKARAVKQVGLEYLPTEVRIRAQEALNVATDPENIKKISAKIEQETQARLGAAYAPESITGPIVLLQTTEGALNELKTRFSPQDREKYVGILLNPALRAMQLINPDPRFAEFQAIMGRVKKSAFDDGGKQLTPFEFSVVSQYIPQGNENSWQDFEAKLAIAGDYTRMLINARSEISTMTRKRLGAEGVPQIRLDQGKNIPSSAPQGAAPQNNDPLGIRR